MRNHLTKRRTRVKFFVYPPPTRHAHGAAARRTMCAENCCYVRMRIASYLYAYRKIIHLPLFEGVLGCFTSYRVVSTRIRNLFK